MPPLENHCKSWTTDLHALKRFADWRATDEGGARPWSAVVFPYRRAGASAMIPSDASGVYLIVHSLDIPAIRSDRSDRLRTVVYVGQGHIRSRYKKHVSGDTNRRLQLVLDSLASMPDSSFAFYWKLHAHVRDRDYVEGLIYDALGPVGNDIQPPRVRLNDPIPAG